MALVAFTSAADRAVVDVFGGVYDTGISRLAERALHSLTPIKNRAPIYGGLLLITPTFSIRILTQGVGIDKENKVNNLKILDYLRVGIFFRVELAFIDRKEKISAFPKTQSGI